MGGHKASSAAVSDVAVKRKALARNASAQIWDLVQQQQNNNL